MVDEVVLVIFEAYIFSRKAVLKWFFLGGCFGAVSSRAVALQQFLAGGGGYAESVHGGAKRWVGEAADHS